MRAVSLSNPTIIELLNGYYVPVFLSNEDYADAGAASKDEKAELDRIHREGYAKHLSVGSVHAYILAPNGHLIDSMHTAQAAKAELLIAMLRKNVESLRVAAGPPAFKPTPPTHPACSPGGLLLHLTARYLQNRDGQMVPIETATGDWTALPSEDWITLTRAQSRLLVPEHSNVGTKWEIDPKVAADLLVHFYPPTENWDLSPELIHEKQLSGEVVSLTKGIALARLEGRLRMDHSFYHKPDGRYVEASIVGTIEFEPASHHVRSFNVVTDVADYKGAGSTMPYGIAVRLVQ